MKIKARQNECSTFKPRYPNKERARTAAITASKRNNINLSFYECKFCSGWHLTKSIGGANPNLKK